MSRKSNPDKLPPLPVPEKTIRFLEYLRKHTDREHPLKSIKDAREAFRKDRLHLGSDNTIRELYKNIADAYNLDIEQHPLPQSEWRIMYDGYVKLYGDADGEEDLFGEDEPDGMNGDREQFRNLYYVPELSYSEIDALVEAVQLSPTLNQKETAKLRTGCRLHTVSTVIRRIKSLRRWGIIKELPALIISWPMTGGIICWQQMKNINIPGRILCGLT